MEILQPMFGMIVLSGLLVITLLISRISPIVKFWGNLQFAQHSEDLRPQLPRRLRLITDNHNHLMEQPTLFYATCAYIFMTGHSDSFHLLLAWSYVAIRIAHSGIQLTTNNVSYRALSFGLSSACLLAMIIREVIFLF